MQVEGTPLSLACCSKTFRFARKLLELGVQREFDVHVSFSIKTQVCLLKVVLDWEKFAAESNL